VKHAVAVSLWASLLASAAHGCSGYAEGSARPLDAGPTAAPPILRGWNPSLPHRAPPVAGQPASMPTVPTMPTMPTTKPKPKPIEIDAGAAPIPDGGNDANLRLAHSSSFDGYLSDGMGQALYMFIGDVGGANITTCLGDCARDWPPFDVVLAHPSGELDADAVSRFHRDDGTWQTTYNGHPLYYRALETGTQLVTGDGADGRWYIARNYLAFLGSAPTFAPAGGTGIHDPYLTDGTGRTLYVCLDDQPGTPGNPPVTSCDAACTAERPIFAAAATDRTTLLPSAMSSADLNDLTRSDGALQLTYRGWPLYYYSGDLSAGSTAGHNDRAWRAIDPISFGLSPEPPGTY
jgi:predicted lipoprotein with Yx(FWY)xxD motif